MTQVIVQTQEEQEEFERDEQGRELIVTGTDAIIREYETGVLPLYMAKLYELDIPDEEKEPLLSVYKGAIARSFKGFANKEVEIQGAMLDWHPAYKGKDGETHGGYYKLLLLTTQADEDGNLIVISSSSSGLTTHMIAAMQMRGWYLWSQPVKYRLTLGEDGSHHMTNLDKPKKLVVRKK